MTLYIEPLTGPELYSLISSEVLDKLNTEDRAAMDRSIQNSTKVWAGLEDDTLLGFWGLIPPTILSNQAYMWLYTTEHLKEHVFVFVRHSQRAVKILLEQYPNIVGHCAVNNHRAHQWLKWLGAEFGEPNDRFVPFVIKA